MLLPGELTAGIVVRVEHHAPTPLGGTVRMTARYLGLGASFTASRSWRTTMPVRFSAVHVRAVVEARRLEKARPGVCVANPVANRNGKSGFIGRCGIRRGLP